MFLFSQAREGSFSFPTQGSSFAAEVDSMYAFIFWISLFFFIVINGLMVYFVIKYRRKDKRLPEKSPAHHTVLELAWTILPAFILVIMFIRGAWGYLEMRNPPEAANAVERTIDVRAFKYGWQFTYPNGDITSELHLAKNVPVRFRISSRDALHSFFIREFRLKMDCVPGRYTEAWVNPIETRTPSETISVDENGNVSKGEKEPFHLQCAEYCGEGHSQMRTEWKDDGTWAFPVYVHDCSFDELTEFTTWDFDQNSNWKNGEFLFKAYGCVGCHAIEGAAQKVGPNFRADQWRVDRRSATGEVKTFANDAEFETYLSRSINYSTEFIVNGYPNQMPKFEFSPKQLDGLIAFIRSPGQETVDETGETTDPKAGEAGAGKEKQKIDASKSDESKMDNEDGDAAKVAEPKSSKNTEKKE